MKRKAKRKEKGLVNELFKTAKPILEKFDLMRTFVYSEIIFKINTKKVFLFDFQKNFDKSRITLLEQIEKLVNCGLLKEEIQGRKRLFYVDWKKINELFVFFLLAKIGEFEDYLDII